METGNISLMTSASRNIRLSTLAELHALTMEIYSNEIHRRGAISSGRSSEEIYDLRYNRTLPVSVQELPIEILYCIRNRFQYKVSISRDFSCNCPTCYLCSPKVNNNVDDDSERKAKTEQ